jgi:hypothetical protein
MLLELLKHHEDLLKVAILPLIWRRDCRSLNALSVVCKPLHAFISGLHEVRHISLFAPTMQCIKNINAVYNEHISIRDIDGKLSIYLHSRHCLGRKEFDSYSIYTPHIELIRKLIHRKKVKVIDTSYQLGRIKVLIIGEIPDWIYKYPKYIALSEKWKGSFIFKN